MKQKLVKFTNTFKITSCTLYNCTLMLCNMISKSYELQTNAKQAPETENSSKIYWKIIN